MRGWRCASCHVPRAADNRLIQCGIGWLLLPPLPFPPRSQGGKHRFLFLLFKQNGRVTVRPPSKRQSFQVLKLRVAQHQRFFRFAPSFLAATAAQHPHCLHCLPPMMRRCAPGPRSISWATRRRGCLCGSATTPWSESGKELGAAGLAGAEGGKAAGQRRRRAAGGSSGFLKPDDASFFYKVCFAGF